MPDGFMLQLHDFGNDLVGMPLVREELRAFRNAALNVPVDRLRFDVRNDGGIEFPFALHLPEHNSLCRAASFLATFLCAANVRFIGFHFAKQQGFILFHQLADLVPDAERTLVRHA